MSKIHYKYSDVQVQISELYEKGITRGRYMGFESLHEYFSFKDVGTTYIYGAAFSGKTEWWFEVLIYLSDKYKFKHAIYSPESGSASEIFAELISKYLKKPFYKNMVGHMTETEMYSASNFVNEYFYIIDPGDKDITIKDFYKIVGDIEEENSIKINTTCCDPFNEFDHKEISAHGRQDLYLENILGFVRKDARKNKRHNVIITHCTDQDTTLDKTENKRYYALPLPREISGGQAWYRKAMNLICLWRPPEWLKDPQTGEPYKDNEVHIVIYKYKPKGVGKRGLVKLYFDIQQGRYYEIWQGERRYAGDQEKMMFETTIEKFEF